MKETNLGEIHIFTNQKRIASKISYVLEECYGSMTLPNILELCRFP